jgi:hypothetical protein
MARAPLPRRKRENVQVVAGFHAGGKNARPRRCVGVEIDAHQTKRPAFPRAGISHN